MAQPTFRTEYPTRDGRTITVRAMQEDDFAAFAATLNHPEVVWGTMQVPFTPDARRADRYRSGLADPNAFLLAAELDGEVAGNLGLHANFTRARRRHAAGIGMSVQPHAHGQLVGSALMAACIELADDWLNLHRLELDVYTDNEPALALYRKFGFEVEGTLRDYGFRAGHYVDAHYMARIRPS